MDFPLGNFLPLGLACHQLHCLANKTVTCQPEEPSDKLVSLANFTLIGTIPLFPRPIINKGRERFPLSTKKKLLLLQKILENGTYCCLNTSQQILTPEKYCHPGGYLAPPPLHSVPCLITDLQFTSHLQQVYFLLIYELVHSPLVFFFYCRFYNKVRYLS